ncbi:hypothetical protein VB264_16080 [Arcicella aquatica]|uniref:Uncharacterized protein n=1 Tax=Arcicella aquatica TaxID=217141 RepID=A0ABU5QQF6_9BACT|nr:hypothetical protein [Arcicella aquatica]MEA5259317.1 hypothetical protein [Arcicella aquatica]
MVTLNLINSNDLRATRHIAIAKNGDIYAKLSKRKDGKGLYLLKDSKNDGIIDETKLFGDYPDSDVVIDEDLNGTFFKIEYHKKGKLGLKN